MNLSSSIERAISLGYSVSFKREINQLQITVIHSDENETILDKQNLPLREDHFNDVRICECINFMVDRSNEILTHRKKQHL
jgi:hypothetical protein